MTSTYQRNNIRAIGTISDVLLNVYNDVGLAESVGKRGIRTSSEHDANEHITVGSSSDEKVKTFKYLGCSCKNRNLYIFSSLLTNQNSTHEKIKCRL
jgi:hypothetical protein